MHHRIFEIDELARLISCHLVSSHRASAVSLACACRSLEEPALSSLWERQDSLTTLIGVSPIIVVGGEVCDRGYLPTLTSPHLQVTEPDSPGSAWQRFRRHVSWMRLLVLREEDDRWMKADVFNQILAGSTSGLVCPNLCSLTLYFTRANQQFIPRFLSPRLTNFTIRIRPSYRKIPRDLLPDPIPILQALPTSCLQELSINLGPYGTDRLEDEISSVVQRCGHSLRVLSVLTPLGEAAVRRVVGFENLRVWNTVRSPPPSTLPLSTPFPPLWSLILRNDARGWIPWLAQRERGISDARGGSADRVGLGDTLVHLVFCGRIPVDATFISPLSLFPNLAHLSVQSNCAGPAGCVFSLTDQDVIRLSAALPRLGVLDLGHPCSNNTSHTTVSCLLALSVRCKGLIQLKIHLNTTNLIGDIQSLSEDPDFRSLGSLPTRCRLLSFDAGSLPFPHPASDEDITTIAAGLIGIFPSLVEVHPYIDLGWAPLHSSIRKLQRGACLNV